MDTIFLPRAGREYVTWTAAGAPDGAALEVSVDDGTTWQSLERDGDAYRALVAGPEADANPEGTVVLSAGKNVARLRLVDASETVIRDAGTIRVP